VMISSGVAVFMPLLSIMSSRQTFHWSFLGILCRR
jgi:hypothetical protein